MSKENLLQYLRRLQYQIITILCNTFGAKTCNPGSNMVLLCIKLVHNITIFAMYILYRGTKVSFIQNNKLYHNTL